jgi:hypothetical protein
VFIYTAAKRERRKKTLMTSREKGRTKEKNSLGRFIA